jgi:hypothetical protein
MYHVSTPSEQLPPVIHHTTKTTTTVAHHRATEWVNSNMQRFNKRATKISGHFEKHTIDICTSLFATNARLLKGDLVVFECHCPFVLVVGHSKKD